MPVLDPRLAEHLWRTYADDVALACAAVGDPAIDTPLVLAIGLRETWLGTCEGYEPKGLMGRGDGGHGRGLFQIDDRGPWRHLIPEDGQPWPAFVQALAACRVLAQARADLAEFQSSPAYELAVICNYNASLENVRWALRNGRDPNAVTTGKDYGRDVQALRDGLRRLYPETFPLPTPQQPATPAA